MGFISVHSLVGSVRGCCTGDMGILVSIVECLLIPFDFVGEYLPTGMRIVDLSSGRRSIWSRLRMVRVFGWSMVVCLVIVQIRDFVCQSLQLFASVRFVESIGLVVGRVLVLRFGSRVETMAIGTGFAVWIVKSGTAGTMFAGFGGWDG